MCFPINLQFFRLYSANTSPKPGVDLPPKPPQFSAKSGKTLKFKPMSEYDTLIKCFFLAITDRATMFQYPSTN